MEKSVNGQETRNLLKSSPWNELAKVAMSAVLTVLSVNVHPSLAHAEGLNTGFDQSYWRKVRSAKGIPDPSSGADTPVANPVAETGNSSNVVTQSSGVPVATPAITSGSPEVCAALELELARNTCSFSTLCGKAMGRCSEAQLACNTRACVNQNRPTRQARSRRVRDACRQGLVWRERTPSDHVCVTPAERAEAQRPADACPQGLVWRESTPTDHVCVTPAVREAVRNGTAVVVSGPGSVAVATPVGQACPQGLVWRESTPTDHVCVTPAVREAVRNGTAVVVSGPGSVAVATPVGQACPQGLVWRGSTPTDYVCVTPAVREAARNRTVVVTGSSGSVSVPNAVAVNSAGQPVQGVVVAVPAAQANPTGHVVAVAQPVRVPQAVAVNSSGQPTQGFVVAVPTAGTPAVAVTNAVAVSGGVVVAQANPTGRVVAVAQPAVAAQANPTGQVVAVAQPAAVAQPVVVAQAVPTTGNVVTAVPVAASSAPTFESPRSCFSRSFLNFRICGVVQQSQAQCPSGYWLVGGTQYCVRVLRHGTAATVQNAPPDCSQMGRAIERACDDYKL
jgi:hypothetical protein